MAVDAPNRDQDRRSDLAVMDANEYKQKRRLERILDAMDAIPDQADVAKEEYASGEIHAHARRMVVQDAVKNAIWEAWTLLVDHDNKCQQDADEDAEGIETRSDYFIGSQERGPLGTVPGKDGQDRHVWGLREFFLMDDTWVETWTEAEKPRNCAIQLVEKQQRHSMPLEVSWAAAIRLKEFLNAEHDMEIQFEEMDDQLPSWGFEEVHRDAE